MSIITNADGMDPAKKAALQKEDDQIEHVADQIGKRIAETSTEAPAPMVWDDTRENAVTFDQIKDERGIEGAPVIPIGYEDNIHGGVDWKLGPYHFEMVKQGKVCHRCLEWQSEVGTTHCMWRGKTEGCGAERVGFASTLEVFGRK